MSAPREERLLELLLAEPAGLGDAERRELDELRADPTLAGTVAETEAAVTDARAAARRAAAADLTSLREGRLVGRILALTTREDLSWRGELRLLRRFVVERLAQSPALRWVAASLVLHLCALPFFGTELVELLDPRVRLRFEPPVELPAEPQDELAVEDTPPLPDPAGEAGGPDPAAIDNALRRARFELSRARAEGRVPPPPAAGALVGVPLEIRLLAARSRGLEERTWEAWLEDGEGLAAAGAQARALWVEVLLDRHVLTGRRAAVLAPTLNRLALAPDTPLARHALDRARAYGLWEAPAGFDPDRAPAALGPAWRAALERTLVRDPDATPSALDAWLQAWLR